MFGGILDAEAHSTCNLFTEEWHAETQCDFVVVN